MNYFWLMEHQYQIIIDSLNEIKQQFAASSKEFLNVKEAADFLGISIHQIYKYSSQKILPHYKPQNKVLYFKRSELIDFISAGRIKSQAEVEAAADKFLNSQKIKQTNK